MMKMQQLIAVAIGISLVGAAHAAVIFNDDFESDTLGAGPAQAGWGTSGMTVTNGVGLTGQALAIYDDPGGWKFGGLNPSDAAVMTMSFDALFDDAFLGDGYFRIAMNGDVGTLNYLDWGQNWDMRRGIELATNVVQHFDVVMNMGGATVNYNGDSIAHDEFAVWANGVNVLQGTMDQTGSSSGTTVTDLGLWINGGTTGSGFHLDNVVVRNEAYAIPEPGTLGLIGAFGGVLIFIRRRFMI